MSASDGEKPKLPTVEELKQSVISSKTGARDRQLTFEGEFKSEAAARQAEYAHLAGLLDHYKHKQWWSYFLMLLMVVMIGFQSFLLYKVGVKEWDFKDYEWLLPALLVQNLGQVVGLAVFVVRSLFK